MEIIHFACSNAIYNMNFILYFSCSCSAKLRLKYILLTHVKKPTGISALDPKFQLFEPPRGKTNNVVSEQVRHKPTCTSTEKSWKLEISDLSRRGIVLSE